MPSKLAIWHLLMNFKIFSGLLASVFLYGCSSSHLEIFPKLEDPQLVQAKIEPAKLKEDIDAYYFGALERHPNLEKYANKEELAKKVSDLKAKMDKPMTRAEFFKVVGQLTHKFNDGHSMLLWPYQEFNQITESGSKPFPFAITINSDNQVFFKKSYNHQGKDAIASGTKLLEINGVPVEELFNTMQQYTGGESGYLRKQFAAGRIGIYLWAVYGFIDDFNLVVENNGDVSNVVVRNSDSWEPANVDDKSKQDFYYNTLESGIGYLYVGSFDVDPDWFEEFANNTFEQIQEEGITALIVDVRDNTGGNTDTATYLSRYLANDKFRMISSIKEKINTDNAGIFNYRGEPGDIIEEQWDDWLKPVNANGFSGDVYVLISPITYSSGIVFASTMKDHKFATLIGQETGGNANQTAQGNLFNLPHSKLRAYITTRMLVRPSGSLAPGGVKPHHVTEVNEATLSNDNDPEVNKALELINQK